VLKRDVKLQLTNYLLKFAYLLIKRVQGWPLSDSSLMDVSAERGSSGCKHNCKVEENGCTPGGGTPSKPTRWAACTTAFGAVAGENTENSY